MYRNVDVYIYGWATGHNTVLQFHWYHRDTLNNVAKKCNPNDAQVHTPNNKCQVQDWTGPSEDLVGPCLTWKPIRFITFLFTSWIAIISHLSAQENRPNALVLGGGFLLVGKVPQSTLDMTRDNDVNNYRGVYVCEIVGSNWWQFS